MEKRLFFKKIFFLIISKKQIQPLKWESVQQNVFSNKCWRESSFSSVTYCSHLRDDCKNVYFKASKVLDILDNDNDNNLILLKKKKKIVLRYIFHKCGWLTLGSFMDSDSDLEPHGKGFWDKSSKGSSLLLIDSTMVLLESLGV